MRWMAGLIAASVLAIAGCGDDSDSGGMFSGAEGGEDGSGAEGDLFDEDGNLTDPDLAPQADSGLDELIPRGERAVYDDTYGITVVDVVDHWRSTDPDGITPRDEHRHVAIELELDFPGETASGHNGFQPSLWLRLRNTDDFRVPPLNVHDLDPLDQPVEATPDTTLRGWAVFELPLVDGVGSLEVDGELAFEL